MRCKGNGTRFVRSSLAAKAIWVAISPVYKCITTSFGLIEHRVFTVLTNSQQFVV